MFVLARLGQIKMAAVYVGIARKKSGLLYEHTSILRFLPKNDIQKPLLIFCIEGY